jgi:hypothetical protein
MVQTFRPQVIASFERHETRAWDPGCEPASFIERLHRIVAAMEHESRRLDLREKVDDVDLVHAAPQSHRLFPRGRLPLQVIEPLHLLGGAATTPVRARQRCETAAKNLARRRPASQFIGQWLRSSVTDTITTSRANMLILVVVRTVVRFSY